MRKRLLFLLMSLCLTLLLLVGGVTAAGEFAIQNMTKRGNTVSASIICGSESVNVICATYDEKGKMLASQTKTVSKTGKVDFTFSENSFFDAKIFLLDSTNAPLCENQSLSGGGNPVSAVLTSEEIYQQCSPAVFYIALYDVNGRNYATASGFFIDESGIAITNYHVIDGAVSATATLTDNTTHPISGILYANREDDYAVIKVEGSGFTALKTGDSSTISGGQMIYTIGNPEGLTNTISSGMISNPRRAEYNDMIQISAPISPGSSGGALIDVYGRAIGITQGGYVSGQNLNFAVPINKVFESGTDPEEFEVKYGVISLKEFNMRDRQKIFEKLKLCILENYNKIRASKA